MKAVIPAAGQGTRLYPQTHTKPKPMVRIAGKPILGHILDNLRRSPIDEAVVVVGVMREMVESYVERAYGEDLEVSFVEQAHTEGLGHSIYQAEPVVGDEPMIIVLGDMLFDSEYSAFFDQDAALDDIAGSLGTKRVDDPSSYGIVTMENGEVVNLEEKPTDPDSNQAISGVYFVHESSWLFEKLDYLISNDIRGAADEYQLTDALQLMLEDGASFGMFEVEEWYDCGQPETLLDANRNLLEQAGNLSGEVKALDDSSVVIPPVDIGEEVSLEASVIGPHVSIDDGASVVESHVTDSIVGKRAELKQVNLESSLVGDSATVLGQRNQLNVGDNGEVQL